MPKSGSTRSVKIEFWIDAADYKFLRWVAGNHSIRPATLVRWLVRAWLQRCRGVADVSRLPVPEPGTLTGQNARPRRIPGQYPRQKGDPPVPQLEPDKALTPEPEMYGDPGEVLFGIWDGETE